MAAAKPNAVLSMDIVIPTYSRGDQAPTVANALEAQLREDDRVYIVWQGSDRPEAGAEERIRLVHSAPPNLPRARNRGVKAGEGEIVLFLDDDVEVREGLIENHRVCYRDPNVGAVAGNIDDSLFDTSQQAPSLYDEKTGDLKQSFAADRDQETISFMGANMSVLRSALQRIGGFDERFGGNGLWEEIDTAFRLRKTGYIIRYASNASVKHLRLGTGGCRAHRSYRYLFHQFANTAYFAAKHAPRHYYGSWMRFWWYRLEYLSRTGRSFPKHDPLAVFSALVGAGQGIWRKTARRKETRYL